MLTAERRQRILEEVETRNSVSVTELCHLLRVSDMTIRRDLRALSDKGMLERVHGGALARRDRINELPYLIRSTENIQQKRIIGQRAAEYIHDGDSIALDIGTTTLELAKAMVGIRNLTVLTANLLVAEVLKDAPNIRLVISGGELRFEEFSLVGPFAQRSFKEFRIDKAFASAGGMDLKKGLTDYNHQDIQVKQALITHANQVIALVDSSKFGVAYEHVFAPLSMVDYLITDEDAPLEGLNQLTLDGIKVIVAERERV